MRYIPVMNILKKYSYLNLKKILEVGSGANGLGDYISFDFIGCDVKFEGKINPKLHPILCSAESLPFKDNSFEVVISLDMLEHIKDRKDKVVNELIRVAKERIIIAFPCGEKSKRCDQMIALWYKLIYRKYPNWLSEHLENELPSENQIQRILNNKRKISYYVLNNENIFVHLAIIIFESIPLMGGYISSKLGKLFSTKFGWIINHLHFGTPYRKIFVISKKASENNDNK